MKGCRKNNHEFYTASISSEMKKEVFGTIDYFKIVTLICRRCGEMKELEIEKHSVRKKEDGKIW